MNARVLWIIVGVVIAMMLAGIAVVALAFFALIKWVDSADAHVCGLAEVKRSQQAAALLGTPIEQKGLTGGSTHDDNGVLNEDITFTVAGPKGEASVESKGTRSPTESHLVVTLSNTDQTITIYDGKFDCPELQKR